MEAPRVQKQPSTSTVPPSHLLRETSRGALTAPLSAPLGFWAGGLLPAVRLSLNSKLHLLTRQTGRQCPGRCPAPWAAGQLGASWPRVLEAGAPGPAPPAAVVSRVGQALASVGAGAGAGPRLLGTGEPPCWSLAASAQGLCLVGVCMVLLVTCSARPFRGALPLPHLPAAPELSCAACSGKTGTGEGGKEGQTGRGGPCTPPLAAELWGRSCAWGSVLTGSFAKPWVRALGPARNFQDKVVLGGGSREAGGGGSTRRLVLGTAVGRGHLREPRWVEEETADQPTVWGEGGSAGGCVAPADPPPTAQDPDRPRGPRGGPERRPGEGRSSGCPPACLTPPSLEPLALG